MTEEMKVVVDKVNPVLTVVRKMTNKDFRILKELADSQINYIHPLKGAKQIRINKLGQNNLMVLNILKALKYQIKSAKSHKQ